MSGGKKASWVLTAAWSATGAGAFLALLVHAIPWAGSPRGTLPEWAPLWWRDTGGFSVGVGGPDGVLSGAEGWLLALSFLAPLTAGILVYLAMTRSPRRALVGGVLLLLGFALLGGAGDKSLLCDPADGFCEEQAGSAPHLAMLAVALLHLGATLHQRARPAEGADDTLPPLPDDAGDRAGP